MHTFVSSLLCNLGVFYCPRWTKSIQAAGHRPQVSQSVLSAAPARDGVTVSRASRPASLRRWPCTGMRGGHDRVLAGTRSVRPSCAGRCHQWCPGLSGHRPAGHSPPVTRVTSPLSLIAPCSRCLQRCCRSMLAFARLCCVTVQSREVRVGRAVRVTLINAVAIRLRRLQTSSGQLSRPRKRVPARPYTPICLCRCGH